mmetsp:Transcript_10324/g.21713  ORF Transcript_10324/g.21713 Transcript_10324/m.21713 type:complete len:247 (-) Transcript_10324:252-992(-)
MMKTPDEMSWSGGVRFHCIHWSTPRRAHRSDRTRSHPRVENMPAILLLELPLIQMQQQGGRPKQTLTVNLLMGLRQARTVLLHRRLLTELPNRMALHQHHTGNLRHLAMALPLQLMVLHHLRMGIHLRKAMEPHRTVPRLRNTVNPLRKVTGLPHPMELLQRSTGSHLRKATEHHRMEHRHRNTVNRLHLAQPQDILRPQDMGPMVLPHNLALLHQGLLLQADTHLREADTKDIPIINVPLCARHC